MSFFDRLPSFSFGSPVDMAIDLGTANTLVALNGEGVVINEPSVVAIEKSTQRVLAVGHEAKNMINHTPDAFTAVHPLKDGVIADYDITEAMLSAFINRAFERSSFFQQKPRIVICIPCGATSVEKRAVFEAAIQAGARQAFLIEEPMAAAIGAPVSVMETAGEGGAWGAALLAKYRADRKAGETLEAYLADRIFAGQTGSAVEPDAADEAGFREFLNGYKRALKIERACVEVL